MNSHTLPLVPFGKYKNELLYDVFREDFEYAEWLSSKWEGEVDYKVTDYIKSKKPKEVVNKLKYLPKTNIEIPTKVDYTSNIEGLDITVIT